MSDPSVVEDEMRPVQPPRPRPGVQSPQVNTAFCSLSMNQTKPLQRDIDYDPTRTYTERPQRRQVPSGLVPGSYMTSTPQNQLEADEMYARQLAEHFETNNNRRTARGGGGRENFNARDAEARRKPQQPLRPPQDDDYDSDKEHSFLDGECS